MAGPEAGDARLALEIAGDAIVGLLHPVGRDFDLQPFSAGRDIFKRNGHGSPPA
jgi:hypothetical protein